MHRVRLRLLPLFCGLLVALTIQLWPASPRWSRRLQDASRQFGMQGANTSGQRLFVEEFKATDLTRVPCELVEVSVADGQELSRFHVADDEDDRLIHHQLIGKGDKLFAIYQMNFPTGKARWVVLDSRDGHRLFGPLPHDRP